MATFRGKDALLAKLRASVPAVETAATEVSKQTADEMVGLARSFVPVDTGKLRDSIHVEPGDRPASFRVKAGGPTTTREVRSGSGKPYDYSVGVEFGTSQHTNAGIFAGSDNPGARRQPFFWPAYRLIRKRLRGRMSRALSKAIKGAT